MTFNRNDYQIGRNAAIVQYHKLILCLFQFYHGDSSLIHDPWVKQTSALPKSIHHDHSTATGDRTRDAWFQIPDAKHSAKADSSSGL